MEMRCKSELRVGMSQMLPDRAANSRELVCSPENHMDHLSRGEGSESAAQLSSARKEKQLVRDLCTEPP